jgi:Ca2+-binding EF-hand superfamily protein
MMKLVLGGASAAALVAIVPAVAQPAPPPPPGVAQGTAPIAPVPAVPRIQTHDSRMPIKTETRDEVVAHVREMFAKLDSNKDGFVTRAEADAAHQAMMGEMREKFEKHFADGGMPHPDRGAMFDKLDTNRDGSISRQEFMSAKPDVREQHVFVMRNGEAPVEAGGAHVPGTPEGPARVTIMREGDAPMEISSDPGHPGMRVMRMHPGGMGMAMHGRMFEDADPNHDGKVSLQEMTNAALQHFDSADANHDGKLSPDERMKMHPRIEMHHIQPA